MSLNGLDATQLQQTFESACLEPGSWFLLHYVSRDDIELLAKGSNGAVEMRERIAKEPDDSPLYGFLRYRRRNILIKYLPEATSRVLKARSQVHFQLVGERFTPHDITFSISNPQELTDSALTSACSTHSASASVSSSNSSLRTRRLADIAESAEESPCAPKTYSIPDLPENDEGPYGPTVVVTSYDTAKMNGAAPVVHHDRTQHSGAGRVLICPEDEDETSLRSPNQTNLTAHSHLDHRRKSTSSTRPTIIDLYGVSYSPKIILGPRPAADALKRPHTSGSHVKSFGSSVEESRPIATVPKSVQLPLKRSSPSGRTKSLSSDSTHSLPLDTPGQSISATSQPHMPIAQPPSPLPKLHLEPAPVEPASPSVLSPERQRLMRALQIRKSTMLPQRKESNSKDIVAVSLELKGETHMNSAQDPARSASHSEKEVKVATGISSNTAIGEQDEVQQSENTKVRGSDNENDSDGSDSIMSVEIAVAEPRPVSIYPLRASTMPMSPLPSTDDSRTPTVAINVEKRAYPASVVVSKKSSKTNTQPTEESVIETARSVSAPFLSKARRERTSIAVPKTVNVSSGSVSQRIKQLEMLNKLAPIPTPPRSPSIKPSPAITPPGSIVRPSSSHTSPIPFRLNTSPTQAPPSPPVIKPYDSPAIPEKSKSRGTIGIDEKGVAQVTTIISRPSPPEEIISATLQDSVVLPPPVPSPIPINTPSIPENPIGISSVFSTGRNNVDHGDPFRDDDPAVLQKLNLDMNNLPPLPISPIASPISSSPGSPITGIRNPFSRDKEKAQERKEAKKEARRKGRSRSRSPKEEKKPVRLPLIRRMSSLGTKSREPATPIPEVPSEPAPRTCLLAGWVNVQLPDTMLWRRKCLKVDSVGWLFLSVTDDEHAPLTKKYHIPSEISSVTIPDPDEQELPFSVRLDLKEGGSLQCACQNSREQKEVYSVILGQFC